ncbi:MAG: ribosome assembly factor SBDS [Candidatus Bathyarchaeota archaeon]|nr:ribosome assembly factor SBDS [Candidatus Bathyarchaeota archaeon]
MGERHTTARLTLAGERFEILVRPEPAFDFKQGRSIQVFEVLVADVIFTDASKGLRASEEQLQKAFHTTDTDKVADTILKRGELQLTIEQRRNLVDEKRKQIVSFIARHCVDPRTGFPHPPLRIEQAMEQIRLVVDPFKDGEEQARAVIEDLRPILPLKMEQLTIAVKVPAEYAAQTIGVAKNFAKVSQEEWQRNGSWIGVVEMPAGLHTSFLERIGAVTHGNYQTKIIK